MMALPKQGEAYTFYIALGDKADPDTFLADPTIATGDFQVSKDGGAFVNIANDPNVTPAGSIQVQVNLTADEMDSAKVNVQGIDLNGEWQDIYISIDVPTGNIETMLNIELGDRIETNSRLLINKAGTNEPVLDKAIAGSLLQDSVTIRTEEP